MDLPPRIKIAGKVCKLNKTLYGLKQSPRAWFGRFSKFMKRIGYKQSDTYHTLFIKQKLGKITTLIVYVDHMVVTGNDSSEISTHYKKNPYLQQKFCNDQICCKTLTVLCDK